METFITNTVPGVRRVLRGIRYIGLSLFIVAAAAHGIDDDSDNDSMERQRHYHHSRFIAFGAYDGTDTELWKNNGRESGTRLVKNIYPGNFISSPRFFVKFKREYYFIASDDTITTGLRRTDGTEAGTILVTRKVTPANGVRIAPSFQVFRGELYFTANDPHPDSVSGISIWKTDGTEGGTVQITDFARDVSGSAGNFKTFNGSLCFAADDGVNGMELWKTNGTASGKVIVKDINPGAAGSSSSSFTGFKGRLYFSATVSDGTFFPPRLIWKTNGTDVGTVQVAQASVGTNRYMSGRGFTIYRNTFYFIGGDTRELWRSNGTAMEGYRTQSGPAETSAPLTGGGFYFVPIVMQSVIKPDYSSNRKELYSI